MTCFCWPLVFFFRSAAYDNHNALHLSTESREAIDPHVQGLSDNINTTGDLNYVITRLALRLLEAKGVHYDNMSNVIGTLHCAAAEMIRRFISPYEDTKIEQNGDVPEYADMLLKLHTTESRATTTTRRTRRNLMANCQRSTRSLGNSCKPPRTGSATYSKKVPPSSSCS